MEAVLPVDYVDFDHSVEETGDVSQMSAEEYLSWVRHQASQLPNVFCAHISTEIPLRQSKYMPEIETILQCPQEFLPTEEWEIEILHSFSELRSSLSRLSANESTRERIFTVPQMKDHAAWRLFCLGEDGSNGDIEQQPLDTEGGDTKMLQCDDDDVVLKRKRQLEQSLGMLTATTTTTTLSVVKLVDDDCVDADNDEELDEYCYPDVNQDLAYTGAADNIVLPKWSGVMKVSPTTSLLLQFDQVLTQKVLGYHIDWLEDSVSLTAPTGQWIYSLLARLEKPVCQATVAYIRQLYRRCCSLRYNLVSSDNSSVKSDTFDADLAALNVLISITGAYFGQGEEYVAFNHQNYAHLLEEDLDAMDEEGDEEEEEIDCEDDSEDNDNNKQDNTADDTLEENSGKRARFDEFQQNNNNSNGAGSIHAATAGSMELESGECIE